MPSYDASPTRDIAEDISAIRSELTRIHRELSRCMTDAVNKDHTYRLEKAKAMARAEGSSADKRDSEVELIVNNLRREAKLAEKLERSALERLQTLRDELKAVTSMAWVHRSELELAR